MRALYVSTSILLDLELIHISIYIYILTSKIKLWNRNIKSIDFGDNNNEIAIDKVSLLEELEKTIISMNDAWGIIMKTSGFSILIHFITTFVQVLVYVGVLIIWSNADFVSNDFNTYLGRCEIAKIQSQCYELKFIIANTVTGGFQYSHKSFIWSTSLGDESTCRGTRTMYCLRSVL
ncbi:hypothetical protein HF086_006446 [Spodoptera exigua]|uniref:Uncharacterized protein n=1 Tax=Spodoptera exigua TaxID=7107 RepID=A0A922SPB8_SPOEX|nr:hypothetical protein HF086_006446 [Spodoptera exigua]